jgi:hypothetical protein
MLVPLGAEMFAELGAGPALVLTDPETELVTDPQVPVTTT